MKRQIQVNLVPMDQRHPDPNTPEEYSGEDSDYEEMFRFEKVMKV